MNLLSLLLSAEPESTGSSAFYWFHFVAAWLIAGAGFFVIGYIAGRRIWRLPPQPMEQVKQLRLEEEKLKTDLRNRESSP